MEIMKADRWKWPSVRHVNYRESGSKFSMSIKWPLLSFNRYWGGRIWNLGFRHHAIVFDFRACVLSDMAFSGSKLKDTQAAIQEAQDIANTELRNGEAD